MNRVDSGSLSWGIVRFRFDFRRSEVRVESSKSGNLSKQGIMKLPTRYYKLAEQDGRGILG